MKYEGRVFRPPSEAYSLIIQVTIGCSNNTCAFCGMYKDKRFHLRPLQEIIEEIESAGKRYTSVKRIFLADGDALIRDFDELTTILDAIKTNFPLCERVSCYASPRSIASKTDDELSCLQQCGLKMVFMGLESGNDHILKFMSKGSTAAEITLAGRRIIDCCIKLSISAIVGLGGRKLWRENAIDTGKVISAIKPDYIGMLTLMLDEYAPLYWKTRNGYFEVPDSTEMLAETRLLLENIDSEGSVFRMTHASNYLNLRGTLNKDTDYLISLIDSALEGNTPLKPEHYRGL